MVGTKRTRGTVTIYKGQIMKIQPIVYIKEQITWLKSFLSEPDGKASNKRLISFAVVGSYLFAYVKTSLYNNKIEDIPINWAFLITALLGIGVYDKWVTNKNGNTNGNSAQ